MPNPYKHSSPDMGKGVDEQTLSAEFFGFFGVTMSVCMFVCLFMIIWVIELLTQLKQIK